MRKKIMLEDLKKVRDLSVLPINFRPMAKISPYLSYISLRYLHLVPNQITFSWGFLGILSFLIISFGGYWNMLEGVLIYQFAILLDYLDGEMARVLKVKDVTRGAYLDKIFSIIFRGLLILGLGIGLYNTNGNVIYFYLGIWACMLLIFDNLNKLKMYEVLIAENRFDFLRKHFENIKGAPKFKGDLFHKLKFYGKNLIVPIHPFSFLFFSILFNISQYYLILIAVISPILFIKNFVEIYKKLGEVS